MPTASQFSAAAGRPPIVAARRPPIVAARQPPIVAARRPPIVAARRPPIVAARWPPTAAVLSPPDGRCWWSYGRCPPAAVLRPPDCCPAAAAWFPHICRRPTAASFRPPGYCHFQPVHGNQGFLWAGAGRAGCPLRTFPVVLDAHTGQVSWAWPLLERCSAPFCGRMCCLIHWSET